MVSSCLCLPWLSTFYTKFIISYFFRYTDSAKIVARTLTRLGFRNTWIVADGFSGSKGWLQSRLGTDSYNISFAEVVSPSRVISAASRRFGTASSAKLLPGGSDWTLLCIFNLSTSMPYISQILQCYSLAVNESLSSWIHKNSLNSFFFFYPLDFVSWPSCYDKRKVNSSYT